MSKNRHESRVTSHESQRSRCFWARRETLDARREDGVILVGALVTMVFLMVVALSAIDFSLNHYNNSRRSLVTLNALAAAEAGGDYFMQQINKPSSTYAGTGGEYTFYNDPVRGKGTYETTITNGSIANEKIITSTGRIYLPNTAASPLVTRKIRLIITSTTSPAYTVQSGPGGLVLNNNVHIATGPIYLGGRLTLNNNASIGSIAQPVAVNAADIDCPSPPDASYPVQCTSSPPYTISMGPNSHIYGSVSATNGIDVPSRATNPGLISNSVSPVPYPVIDHNTVTSGHGWTNRSDSGACANGTTWAANIHFTGDVSLGNNCSIIVNGDVWINGTLNMGNNSAMTVASGLAAPPKIIIDGYSSSSSNSFITGNNASLNANSIGTGFQILSYYSFNAGGTGPSDCSPSCGSLTGTQLAASQTKTTLGIGNNFSAAVGTLFYARWTQIAVNNNVTIGSLIGQTIILGNNGNIIFSGGNSGGGTVTWDVKYWEQLFR